MTLMDKAFDFQTAQTYWYAQWEAAEIFKADPQSGKTPFSMSLPPPNITGNLHMGHALCYTLPDVLARAKRAQGFDVCWVPGIDHAGIATQVIVERQLKEEGTDRHQLGREKFLKRIWEWKHQNQSEIESQMKRLGISVDWSRKRFTMDEALNEAVRKVFVEAYDQGRIYRGPRMIQWDPVSQTALSDLEVKHVERQGKLWHIRYPLLDSNESIIVATTRPETMVGDTAVAVHPEDERYRHLVGKKIKQPLTHRIFSIVADDFVDPSFGSGCVKITPGHDVNDHAVGQRLGLEVLTVIGFDAKMTEAAGAYQGLDRFECRKRIINDLEKEGFLVKADDHISQVATSERTGAVLEPLVSEQWFMKMKESAAEALSVVRKGDITFTPAHHGAVWEHWLTNIQDWCISRQLVWGHRIPAWHCSACKHIAVSLKAPLQCSQCPETTLVEDPDTLDTWFSSALWPFSILGWPNETGDLKRYYPNDVMCTSYDIIFFWVARMVMSGLTWTQSIPFKKVYFNSLVRDAAGQKMSKSKGNVVDPLAVMDQYGTDALRFTLISMSAPGTDIALSTTKLETSRNFCTKLWNAARFVQINIDDSITLSTPASKGEAEHWMADRLRTVMDEVHQSLDVFRFHDAADRLYHLIYDDFCGTYIELAKVNLTKGTPQQKAAILQFLDIILRLLHPMVPFLTEQIHAAIISTKLPAGEPLMLAQRSWPSQHPFLVHEGGTPGLIASFQSVLSTIMRLKADHGLDPAKKVPCWLTLRSLEPFSEALKSMGRLDAVHFVDSIDNREDLAVGLAAEGKIALGLPSIQAEGKDIDKMTKERIILEKEIASLGIRLKNQAFLDKAQPEALAKAQLDLQSKTNRLQQIIDLLK